MSPGAMLAYAARRGCMRHPSTITSPRSSGMGWVCCNHHHHHYQARNALNRGLPCSLPPSSNVTQGVPYDYLCCQPAGSMVLAAALHWGRPVHCCISDCQHSTGDVSQGTWQHTRHGLTGTGLSQQRHWQCSTVQQRWLLQHTQQPGWQQLPSKKSCCTATGSQSCQQMMHQQQWRMQTTSLSPYLYLRQGQLSSTAGSSAHGSSSDEGSGRNSRDGYSNGNRRAHSSQVVLSSVVVHLHAGCIAAHHSQATGCLHCCYCCR